MTITGGTNDEKEFASLPDIFIANIPNSPEISDCVTGTASDHSVVNYPNPGVNGRVLQNPIEPQMKPPNYCSNIPTTLPSFAPDPRTNQGGPPTSLTASSSKATGSTTSITPIVATTMSTSKATSTSLFTSTPKLPTPSVPPQGPGPIKGTVECPKGVSHGALVCLDNEMWGLCNFGFITPQRLAAGTKCVDGKVVAKSQRRDVYQRHMRHHQQHDELW